jgi:hypothetical protein
MKKLRKKSNKKANGYFCNHFIQYVLDKTLMIFFKF